MQAGAELLQKHIQNDSNIVLVVDSDCDGYTSAAMLANYIMRAYAQYPLKNFHYFIHDGKQHGIELDKLPDKIDLLIIPDASSNDNEQVRQLHELGTEVLILDHHHTDSPPKYACIINNQLCDYPNKTLSGAGIVWKFIKYLDSLDPMQRNIADYYLDLAAVGIIGDVMLINEYETHYIIEKGLSHINNPFLKEMIEKQNYSLKGEITPNGIAFYVVPYINAVVRMGTLEEKFLLFESMLDIYGFKQILSTKRGHEIGETESIAQKAVRMTSSVKSRQQKLRDKEVEKLETLIQENNMLDNKVLIFALDEEESVDKNLTGLIANVIMGKYGKPTLLMNHYKNRDEFAGSARAPGNCGFDHFRKFCDESSLVNYAAGHENAFGLSLPDTKVQDMINYCNKELADYSFDNEYFVDFCLKSDYGKLKDLIFEIADGQEYWGQGLQEPYIAIENIRVTKDNVKLLSPDKNPTLKISCNGIDYMKFKATKEEYNELTSGLKEITVIGRCERNVWNGNVSPQIIIENYDIIKERYYF